MIRGRFYIIAALLSVFAAGMPLHAKESPCRKCAPFASKRHSTRCKRVHKHYGAPTTAQSTPSGQPKQYGHVVLEDVHIKAMGVQCNIKRIRLMYKGDGIDASVVGKVLPKDETLIDDPASAGPLYFIMPEKNEKAPARATELEKKESAELKRLAADDKKEVKVVLWTEMNLDPSEVLNQADRCLDVKLAEKIRRLSKKNKEKVTIIDPNLVEQYKGRHPDWKRLPLEVVARDLNADYVINLEIDKLSLYEPNANQQLYRGQTEIQVTIAEKQHPDDYLVKEFAYCYPAEDRSHIKPFEITPHAFRDKFLDRIARRLALYFVDHKKPTK